MTIAGSAGGTVKLIGTDEIEVGESRSYLRVDLPASWQNAYDLIIGLCSVGTVVSDWLYAPFSELTTAGSYTTSPAGDMLRIPLVLQQDNGQVFYRGFEKTSNAVSTGENDFLFVRVYSQSVYLLEGSSMTVYGIKF